MRAWVIGNGPSLARTPLDNLVGEFTIALNRINLIYPTTHWRPTIYVRTDHNPALVDVWRAETLLNISVSEKSYLWEQMKDGYPEDHVNYETMPEGLGNHDKVTWIPRCEHHYWHHDSSYQRRAHEWHLPRICTAYSGIGPAIQVAVIEGATEIYLLGTDLGYGKPKGHDHFSPKYDTGTRKLTNWDTAEVLACHHMALVSSPVPIYNATLGGELEVYPRIDFRKVINGRN